MWHRTQMCAARCDTSLCCKAKHVKGKTKVLPNTFFPANSNLFETLWEVQSGSLLGQEGRPLGVIECEGEKKTKKNDRTSHCITGGLSRKGLIKMAQWPINPSRNYSKAFNGYCLSESSAGRKREGGGGSYFYSLLLSKPLLFSPQAAQRTQAPSVRH